MKQYQQEFIEFAIDNKVLCFGDFTLKSGRKSPYFFNSGLFNSGASVGKLGYFYASALRSSGIEFDLIFGPAYKGIPLATATAIALANEFNINIPFCCNRKEDKDHGEGGETFGAGLAGRVMIIDDVISAGTSVNLSTGIIQRAGATVAGVIVAMDRQEKGTGEISAVQEVEQQHGIRVIHIINLDNLVEYLAGCPDTESNLKRIKDYREIYGTR